MVCANSALPEKKTIGYKERCDIKRAIYRQALAEKQTAGKTIVYADECGFRAESYRHQEYVPKGSPVLGLISGERTRTTLLAALIGSTFTTPCLFDSDWIVRVSMHGVKPTYVRSFLKQKLLLLIM